MHHKISSAIAISEPDAMVISKSPHVIEQKPANKPLIFDCVPYNKRALLKKDGQRWLPQLLFSVGLRKEGGGWGFTIWKVDHREYLLFWWFRILSLKVYVSLESWNVAVGWSAEILIPDRRSLHTLCFVQSHPGTRAQSSVTIITTPTYFITHGIPREHH